LTLTCCCHALIQGNPSCSRKVKQYSFKSIPNHFFLPSRLNIFILTVLIRFSMIDPISIHRYHSKLLRKNSYALETSCGQLENAWRN
jgi:hypothetical protein